MSLFCQDLTPSILFIRRITISYVNKSRYLNKVGRPHQSQRLVGVIGAKRIFSSQQPRINTRDALRYWLTLFVPFSNPLFLLVDTQLRQRGASMCAGDLFSMSVCLCGLRSFLHVARQSVGWRACGYVRVWGLDFDVGTYALILTMLD